jgi:excisionase family DNA binding protein
VGLNSAVADSRLIVMEDAEQWLTASDAARILGLSRDMVRILTQKGRLRSMRAANGYHLFRRGDVEDLARLRAIAKASGRKTGGRPPRS